MEEEICAETEKAGNRKTEGRGIKNFRRIFLACKNVRVYNYFKSSVIIVLLSTFPITVVGALYFDEPLMESSFFANGVLFNVNFPSASPFLQPFANWHSAFC